MKQIKSRIRGIENAQKITAAMQMVSATKLNQANNALYARRFYFKKVETLLNNAFASYDGVFVSPFFKEQPLGDIVLCIVTSDSGLCGTYNNNLLRLSEKFIRERQRQKIKLVLIGKRALNYFKNSKITVLSFYPGLDIKCFDDITVKVSDDLLKLFLSKEIAEIHIAYTYFKSALFFHPEIIKFLNLHPKSGTKINYIFESKAESILKELVEEYLYARLKLIMSEAVTSEYAARTIAMKGATENAKELLHDLVLLRNKVRQTNITRDIIEIISSAESLRRE